MVSRLFKPHKIILSLTLMPVLVFAESRVYVGVGLGYASVDGTNDTDRTFATSAGELPNSITINGLPIDDSDTTWSALVGYAPWSFFAFEVGYTDLGSFENDVAFTGDLAVSAEEFFVGGRFRVPITENIFATWNLGLSRASFDTAGSVTVVAFADTLPPGGFVPLGSINPPRDSSGIFTLPPGLAASQAQEIPWTRPDDETGYIWGFGFEWQFIRHVAAALDYKRHNIQVQDVETVNLSLIYTF